MKLTKILYKLTVWATCFAFIAPFLFFEPDSASAKNPNLIDDNYIISFENSEAVSAFLNKHQQEIISQKNLGHNIYQFNFEKEGFTFFSNRIKNFPREKGVKSVDLNRKIRSFVTPNDPLYSNQWHLTKIRAASGWELETGSAATTTAIIDTGTNYNHADLSGKIWSNTAEVGGIPGVDDDANGYIDDVRGWDFVNSDVAPSDDEGHGTAVTGMATASTNNSQGVAGVDWLAKIMPLKVLDEFGSGLESDLIAAINYAADNGAKVINMSLGGDSYSQSLKNSVDDAVTAGLILVAASGNTPYCTIGENLGVNWPAAFSNVIAVGSTNSSDVVSSFSCSGPEVDVTAPGQSIYSTDIGGGYADAGSGTSFASPQVAGLAGLILAKYPGATYSDVYNRLIHGAEKVAGMGTNYFTIYYGHGRINVPTSLVKLVKISGSAKVYLIYRGTKHHLKSSKVFSYYGVSWSDLETISYTAATGIWTGTPIGYLTKGSSAAVYLVAGNKRYYINDYTLMQMWGFNWNSIETISSTVLNRVPAGGNLMMLAKGSGSPVYAMLGGYGAHVNSADVWNAWQFSWNSITQLDNGTLAILNIVSPDLTRIIKGSGPEIYFVDNGTKRHLQSASSFASFSAVFGGYFTINDGSLNYIPNGAPIN